MDEVAHANGDPHQDLRRDAALSCKPTKGVEIQCDFVLVHRKGSKPNGGILLAYDRLAINVIVNNKDGGINSCDISYTDDLEQFCSDYMTLTQAASRSCHSSFVDVAMVIGTSAMVTTELDSIVNQYTDQFCNPMVMWGRYRKGWFKVNLPISFQFHHVQMDGGHAARFLEELQKTINTI